MLDAATFFSEAAEAMKVAGRAEGIWGRAGIRRLIANGKPGAARKGGTAVDSPRPHGSFAALHLTNKAS